MATFYDRFYQLYEESRISGLGRKEFAELCDVTRGQLNGWLTGKSEPNTNDLKKIARNLDVSLNWLLGDSDIRTPSLKLFEEVYSTLPDKHLEILTLFSMFLKQENEKLKSTREK